MVLLLKIGLALSFGAFGWPVKGDKTPLLKLETGDQVFPSFYYSVKKEGKEHGFLGVIHVGISVEELDCSTQIQEQVSKSDLLFLESNYHSFLSREELKTVYTGSLEEREAVLASLSFDERHLIETRRDAFQSLFFPRFVYHGEHSFEDLSLETQEFLLSIGQPPSDDLGDHFLHLLTSAYYEAYFYYPLGLDQQISKWAFSKGLPIQSLDSNDQILDAMSGNRKPAVSISLRDIEEVVADYSDIVAQNRRTIHWQLNNYRTGNVEKLSEGLEDLPEVALRGRNEDWLKKFKTADENSQNTSIFMAVGLAHLIGPFNILDMLKEEGYSVRRVECPAPQS